MKLNSKLEKFQQYALSNNKLEKVIGGLATCQVKCPDGSIMTSPDTATNCTTNGAPRHTINVYFKDDDTGEIHVWNMKCNRPIV